MARQSIPRSDLYGDLGVDPSADADAVEAAYRSLIDPLSRSEAAADVRRAARLRVAREWLTDPELRRRYDASRARAAARAEKAAAEEALTLVEAASQAQPLAEAAEDALIAEEPLALADEAQPLADEAQPLPTATDHPASADIPWPARDLHRESPDIQWSSTPDAADEPLGAKRRSGVPLGLIGLVALAAVVMVVTYALATNSLFPRVAANPTTSAPPSPAVSQPAESTTTATEVPSAAPTVPPTLAPSAPPPSAAPPSSVPADVAAMQQAAWQTLASLRTAAQAGDVAAAQAFLGDSAPGLRPSGLRRATFPEADASAITIDWSETLYIASVADDRLTSPDGTAWAFDYGDRPLAAYRSPSGEPVHDLWWEEVNGRHDLFVQVAVATLSRSGVTVKVKWSFDPARPGDATYFGRSTVTITSAALDGVPAEVTGSVLPLAGRTSLTASGTITALEGLPSRLAVGLTFTNPRTTTSDDRGIETIFALDLR